MLELGPVSSAKRPPEMPQWEIMGTSQPIGRRLHHLGPRRGIGDEDHVIGPRAP